MHMTSSLRYSLLAAVVSLTFGGCKHHNNPNQFDFSMPIDFSDSDEARMVVPHDDLLNVEASICAQTTKQAQQVGIDLLFLLDNSYSMDYDLKWLSVSNALETFLMDPTLTGVGAGLQYFPLRHACNVADYAMLGALDVNGKSNGVAVTALNPAGIDQLDKSINSRQMSGGTPTLPAIEGMLQYALQNQQANTSRKTVVVLATDGIPDGTCSPPNDAGAPNTIASVVKVVQSYAQGSPAIPTYVIGVGDNLAALDAIAAAGGGTPTAFHIDTSANTEAAFADALNTIRQESLVCQFAVPTAEPGQVLDFNKVNLTFTEQTSSVSYLYVKSKDRCSLAPFNGWYYDNATDPTEIILCDGACDVVRNSTDGQINIVVGCASIIT